MKLLRMTWKPEIKWVPIESVIEYARNPKRHPEAQIQKLAASIHANGFTVPLLVSKDMVIAAGHGRLQAAKSLRMAEVPVIVADHLDEHQLAAYRIMDNKVASLGEWDDDFLKFELGSLDLRGLDLSLTGFDPLELTKLMGASDVSESSLPDLPTGDRGPLRQMAFQLTEGQVETVDSAIALAKSMGEFLDTGSSNSNGNALDRMAKLFLESHGSSQADTSQADQ